MEDESRTRKNQVVSHLLDILEPRPGVGWLTISFMTNVAWRSESFSRPTRLVVSFRLIHDIKRNSMPELPGTAYMLYATHSCNSPPQKCREPLIL